MESFSERLTITLFAVVASSAASTITSHILSFSLKLELALTFFLFLVL